MISSRLAAQRFATTRDHLAAIRAWASALDVQTCTRVDAALEWMIELHIDQADRPGSQSSSQPYVEHTAEVARHVIEWTAPISSDVVIAACLHDALEDQAPKLAGRAGPADRSDADTRKLALASLRQRFGERVAELVACVTNPDLDTRVTARHGAIEGEQRVARKNEIYTEHVVSVFENEPEAAAIKFADFGSNALRIDRVDSSTEAGRARKAKLLQKYAGAMRYLLTYFDSLPVTHPLHANRGILRELVREAWAAEYAGKV